ncbi:hypothetical protein YC2023_065084 [Brassica napus]|uniref:(rape) hypothetical protein n=2 Tax=Brassica TaxID=3705 RepID=A0A816TUD1_BRANA|nr:unnamed protein product [Brassica napus]CAF2102279.1 unnamed protein product [Brassica napus]
MWSYLWSWPYVLSGQMDEAHMEEFDLVAEKQATIEKELMELKQDLDLKKDVGEIIVVLESIRAKF